MAMARMTFTVPEELKARLQAQRGVNWSSVVATALENRLQAMELADRIAAELDLSEEDVEELTQVVKKAVGAQYRADIKTLRRESGSSSTPTD